MMGIAAQVIMSYRWSPLFTSKFLVRTPIDLQKKMNSTDTETPIMAGKERGENSENKTADSQSDDVDMDIDEEPETVQEELVETTRIRESIITNLVRRGNLCTTGL
nr:PREDICTED: uncharacterized protein LOC107399132 isoform X1 [Tribolium castaneum]|eukprot:XP_015840321.1 PREDICTED: uncharacterized protein LOC107399132 isoform X1 [Tribolium castaneum]